MYSLVNDLSNIFDCATFGEPLTASVAKKGFTFLEAAWGEVLFIGFQPFHFPIHNMPDNWVGSSEKYVLQIPSNAFLSLYKVLDMADIKDNWSFINLLYFSEEDNASLETLLLEKDGQSFISKQTALTLKYIHRLQPRLIVTDHPIVYYFLGGKIDWDYTFGEPEIWKGFQTILDKTFNMELISGVNGQDLTSNSFPLLTPVLFEKDWNGEAPYLSHKIHQALFERNEFYLSDSFKAANDQQQLIYEMEQLKKEWSMWKERKQASVIRQDYISAAKFRDKEKKLEDTIIQIIESFNLLK